MKQQYENYTSQDQWVWKTLFERQMTQLPGMASPAFLDGLKMVDFEADKIPDFNHVNEQLEKITGWNLEVVEGLIANKEFFELLDNQRFPATTWLRKPEELDYLEEPDMFHDVFGHVPLLSNQSFCNFLKGLSQIALKHIDSELAIEYISRIYWYTVEFGLIQHTEGLRIYGAGILSSIGESIYTLSDKPKRVPYQVKEIIRTPYIKDKFQEKYFVINSYEQLFESIDEIELVLNQELEEVA